MAYPFVSPLCLEQHIVPRSSERSLKLRVGRTSSQNSPVIHEYMNVFDQLLSTALPETTISALVSCFAYSVAV